VLGVTTVLVLAAAVGFVVVHASHSGTSSAKGGHAAAAATSIRVATVSPASGSRQVDGSAPVMVEFSAPPAAGSPMPVIHPAVAGSWDVIGNDAMFTPTSPFRPHSTYTVDVPAGRSGVRTAGGGYLARPTSTRFTTEGYSQLRLAQLLSQLGYLPLTWAGLNNPATHSQQDAAYSPGSQAALAYDPPAGTFTWNASYPSTLTSQWQPAHANVLLQGALMAFKSEHHMAITGTLDPKVWLALFRAADAGQRNANGYTYALASKAVPETLTIWHDGRQVFRSLANTGIPISPTVDGTFPVYLKYRFQIMQGLNPDGSAYSDPVSFVSYFNGGDAVHYFPRGSYGFQQSLGCVELPYTSAEQAYPYLTYGSLVTVAG
jgi:hypothetical protein